MNNRKFKQVAKFSRTKQFLIYLNLSVLLCLFFSLETRSQVRPVYDYGATGLGQLLKKLNTTKSVMMIGAHPDDEDSALLAFFARGENARTAYLSLTRGDGGQNIIGPELFEPLGVIRTEELQQARRLDGAEQYFTRAFDYGFSKTLTEAKEKWDEKIVICDVVRAIRIFRPLVVISRFTGTPADGHGQHQYAGYLSPFAVKAAADATQCRESGPVWQIQKFYVEQSFGANSPASLQINTGEYDFLLGRSYFEIAMEGRSQHKSQGEGRLETKGNQFSGLNLVESKVPKVEKENSVFDGIDTTLKNVDLGGDAGKNARFEKAMSDALVNYSSQNNSGLLQSLLSGYEAVGDSFERPEVAGNRDLMAREKQLTNAIKLTGGIRIDALADQETTVPGEEFQTTVKVYFPPTTKASVKQILWNLPTGWQVFPVDPPKESSQNNFRREASNETKYFNIKSAANSKPTEPYWLQNDRTGDLFTWPADENQTLPFQPPLVSARVKMEIEGREVTFDQPVQYRFADSVRGEIRRELNLVPELSIGLDRKLLIVPYSEKPQIRRVVMSLTNNSGKPLRGNAGLNFNTPEEWPIKTSSKTFDLKTKGEKTAISFDITIPAKTKPGTFFIFAQAMVGEGLATDEMITIAYPHIQTHRIYTRAQTKVKVLDLKTVPARIGYITGSGDDVPDAIKQLGLEVELLNENDLTSGDLSRFEVIVVGIRASEVRPDFVANIQRLFDFVRNGGTLIVQYQRTGNQNLFPFPAQIGARVVDENAKVTILEPDNSIFNFPNKITELDFNGWIQERNSYAFSTFDQNYKPLLEAHDTGEPENKGGLVVAEIGKGKYVYNSYSFFRQLPGGVGGAYRLFANLLALPKAKK